jgi:hypothetical protein
MSRAFFSACFGLLSALQPSPRAPSVSWSSIRMSGSRAGAGKHVEFHSEFLDAARFSGQFQEEHQRDFLKEKYRDYPPDLVIGVSGSAVAFLMKYRESMFTGGPAVYLTWQGEVPVKDLQDKKAAAISTPGGAEATLRLALALQQDTRNIVIITGSSQRDNGLAEEGALHSA